MTIPVWTYISVSGLGLVWTVLVVRGLQEKMIRRYRLFYSYVAISAAVYAVNLSAAHMMSAAHYMNLYVGTNVLATIMAAFLVLKAATLSRRPLAFWRWVVIVAAPVAAYIAGSLESEAAAAAIVLNAFHVFVFVLAGMNLRRLKGLALGRNYYAILGGILIISTFAVLGHLAAFADEQWAVVLRGLGQPVYWISWLVMLAGMWRYDPPRNFSDGVKTALQEDGIRSC